ncbi:MAG: hypothetical protein S4CHLAM2_12140 [Chlamydiales bacterium]|nr:hypothetical protein [Chlamydiales bacterium]
MLKDSVSSLKILCFISEKSFSKQQKVYLLIDFVLCRSV